MEETIKVYSINPPGLMRPDQDNDGYRPSGVDGLPLGMAYVPMQTWRDIYENGKGLMRGTIFAELDLPFKGATTR